jgi:hypothetical protein
LDVGSKQQPHPYPLRPSTLTPYFLFFATELYLWNASNHVSWPVKKHPAPVFDRAGAVGSSEDEDVDGVGYDGGPERLAASPT